MSTHLDKEVIINREVNKLIENSEFGRRMLEFSPVGLELKLFIGDFLINNIVNIIVLVLVLLFYYQNKEKTNRETFLVKPVKNNIVPHYNHLLNRNLLKY